MNDLDLCLEVVSKSCQELREIRRWISRKPLEIEAWFQRTTNRKWYMGYQMVTWSMTSRDPQRCCKAVRSAILATAWLLVVFLFVIVLIFVRFSHCNFYFCIVFVSQIVIILVFILTEWRPIIPVFVFVTKIALTATRDHFNMSVKRQTLHCVARLRCWPWWWDGPHSDTSDPCVGEWSMYNDQSRPFRGGSLPSTKNIYITQTL